MLTEKFLLGSFVQIPTTHRERDKRQGERGGKRERERDESSSTSLSLTTEPAYEAFALGSQAYLWPIRYRELEWEGGSSHTTGEHELWASPGFPSEMWKGVAGWAEMDRVTYVTKR